MTDYADKPRIVIIAQARMGSTRLPGKVMMDICGKPMVDHVIDRARRSRLADDVVVAIPDLPEDDVLAEHLNEVGVQVVRGSADDVLSRYAKAAAEMRADIVVRITCDCPLIDPELIDEVIAAFQEADVDYCSNVLERTYPIGMDTEVFSREALERANVEARQPHEREHVTPYIWQHPDRFRIRGVRAPDWARRSHLRLTVDEQADLNLVRIVCSRVKGAVSLKPVIELMTVDPDLQSLNAHVSHRYVPARGRE